MRPILYRLNEVGTPVPMNERDRDDVLQWGRWMEGRNRIVARSASREFLISTVFLGVDYAFQGAPVCWETMAFALQEDGSIGYDVLDMDRCTGDLEQAEAMHAAMCEKHGVAV